VSLIFKLKSGIKAGVIIVDFRMNLIGNPVLVLIDFVYYHAFILNVKVVYQAFSKDVIQKQVNFIS